MNSNQKLDDILVKFTKKSDIPKIKDELLALIEEEKKPKEGKRIIVVGRGMNMKKGNN